MRILSVSRLFYDRTLESKHGHWITLFPFSFTVIRKLPQAHNIPADSSRKCIIPPETRELPEECEEELGDALAKMPIMETEPRKKLARLCARKLRRRKNTIKALLIFFKWLTHGKNYDHLIPGLKATLKRIYKQKRDDPSLLKVLTDKMTFYTDKPNSIPRKPIKHYVGQSHVVRPTRRHRRLHTAHVQQGAAPTLWKYSSQRTQRETRWPHFQAAFLGHSLLRHMFESDTTEKNGHYQSRSLTRYFYWRISQRE